MKKQYGRPEISKLYLRPEEKIAVCGWPVTNMTTGSGSCSVPVPWVDIPACAVICQSFYNNADISGS